MGGMRGRNLAARKRIVKRPKNLIHNVAVEGAMKHTNGGSIRCGGKLCYETEHAAENTAAATGLLDFTTKRVYLCPQSGKHASCPIKGTEHWHLTSRDAS